MTGAIWLLRDRLEVRGSRPSRTRNSVGRDEWSAHCPAHDDRSKSFSFSEGDTQAVVLRCHAGCEVDAILRALDLTWTDICNAPERGSGEFTVGKSGGRREVARYRYEHEDGELAYTIVRWGPRKTFTIEPAGYPAEERVPYRYPQLLEAIAEDEPVCIVEGEGDCDTLTGAGIIATTNPFGATHWPDHFDPMFKGLSEVRIIADRDTPGALHALDVARHLRPGVKQVTLWLAAVEQKGADVTDHLNAGYKLDDLIEVTAGDLSQLAEHGRLPGSGTVDSRRLVLTPASSIVPRPVTWLWETGIGEGRMPARSLVIAAGRAGIGKSQFAAWATAQITTGTLPGCHLGHARSVIYCTTEDSWEMTVLPRLMAVGADLDRVYRADVEDDGLAHARLTLPRDVDRLQEAIEANDVVLVVLDPLLSLIDRQIDDYRSREVRDGLEPVVALADRAQVVVLGLAHFTKAAGSDPLLAISGSAAFGQVIRAAIGFAHDEDHDQYVLSTVKNNLGREDLPSLSYTIDPAKVDTPTGPAHVSQFVLTGEESDLTVADLLRNAAGSEGTVKRDAAAVWLQAWLAEQGGSAPRAAVIAAGKAAGFAERTLKRARAQAGVDSERQGFPGASAWRLADPVGPQLGQSGHTRARGPSGPTVAQQEMSLQVCDRCGEPAERLITHHATRERLCPDCCRHVAG